MSAPVPETARAGVLETWRGTSTPVRALLAGTFVNRLGAFLQVFVVLYLVDLGFSATQAAMALGAYSAGSVAGMLLGGSLSDRFGARQIIWISMVGSAGLLLCVLYFDGYVVKLAAIALTGVAGQAYRPAATSLLTELVPVQRQVMVFAMNRLAINLGATALPLIGVALIATSYDLLFWGEALTATGYAIIAFLALPRGRPAAGTRADRGGGFRDMLADRRYLVFLLVVLVHSMIYVQYLSVLPLEIQDRGLGTVVYGVLVGLNGFSVITCELLVAKVVQGRPPRRAVLTGIVLTAAGMSLYGPEWGIAGLLLATLVWSLGEMAGAPTTYFAYPAQAGPEQLRGRYLGAANAAYGLGSTLGPVVGVLIWKQAGGGLWLTCLLAGAAILPAAWYGVRPGTPVEVDR